MLKRVLRVPTILCPSALLGPVTLVTSSIILPPGHPGRHIGHDTRPCVIVFAVGLGQFTPSLGLTLWAQRIREVLLRAEFSHSFVQRFLAV